MCEVGLRAHFHTQAKSRDHEIVRAQTKVPKGRPKTHLQTHIVRSRTFECSVKSYVIGPSTKCYFNESLFKHVLAHDKTKQSNDYKLPKCHGLPVSCPAYPQEMFSEQSPNDHQT
jgi:hypothetical protein